MQGGRPKAREVLFRVLFEVEVSRDDVVESLEYSLGRYHLSEDARDHVIDLARAFARSQEDIDARISATLHGWSFSRLSVVVRAVLRVAVTELLFAPDIPVEIVLDQAIRLAQRYGEDGSDAFVNGVLDRIASEARGNGRTGAGEE
ncbi:MAG: transcription antitermination factor NusB [Candidatus Eisenbacteria bacterium]